MRVSIAKYAFLSAIFGQEIPSDAQILLRLFVVLEMHGSEMQPLNIPLAHFRPFWGKNVSGAHFSVSDFQKFC